MEKKLNESIKTSETVMYNLWNIDCFVRTDMMIFDVRVFQIFVLTLNGHSK